MNAFECLEGKEYEKYIKSVSNIMADLIGSVCSAADEHNVDRDSAIEHFSHLLSDVVEISTFKNFSVGGKKEENKKMKLRKRQ